MSRSNTCMGAAAGFALALVVMSCGADEAPPVEPAPTPPAPSRPTAAADEPMTGPEYDGDHSLPGDPVAGEAVYRARCIACHAADGSGNGGMTGGDFVHDRRRLARNNETLLAHIRDGVPNSPPMPAHAALMSETEMRDALAYIRATFGEPAADEPATP